MPLGVYPKNSYQKTSCCPVVVNRYCSRGTRRGMRILRTRLYILDMSNTGQKDEETISSQTKPVLGLQVVSGTVLHDLLLYKGASNN